MSRQRNLYSMAGSKENTGLIHEGWMVGVPAIVAVNEDPERRHRIKVIIPTIHETMIHNKWCDRLVYFASAPGYGDFHYSEKGSEVVLFGHNAEKYNLYYLPRFNEDHPVPPDFWLPPHTRGFRTDGDYKSIVELDHYMFAGSFELEAHSTVNILAPGGFFINGRRV